MGGFDAKYTSNVLRMETRSGRILDYDEGGFAVRVETGFWLSLVLIFSLFTMAGSGAAGQECPKGLEPVTEYRLFFGLTDKDGKIVTEEEWQQFLADTITPRFPAGLTVFDGRGQWLPPSGKLQREPVKVVLGAVSSDPVQSMKLVDEISARFAKRFRQDAVFRMSSPACAGLHP